MGRKRKLKLRFPKKTLPKRFDCYICGKLKTVIVNLGDELVTVNCSSCGEIGKLNRLKTDKGILTIHKEIDYYNKCLDIYYKGK